MLCRFFGDFLSRASKNMDPDEWVILAHNRASDISRKKKQNFAGFSGANSRKNRSISRDFRGKKVKIRGKIGRFQVFLQEKSQNS